jgi:hypothetical protein
MMRRSKKTGENTEVNFNFEQLKLVGAACLACVAMFYVYTKWTRMPKSDINDTQPTYPHAANIGNGMPGATTTGDDFPTADIHNLLLQADAEGLKKRLEKAGSRRDAWCVQTLHLAVSLRPKMSLGFVLEGLEDRLAAAPSSIKYSFDMGVTEAIMKGSSDLWTDVVLHVKNLDRTNIKSTNINIKMVVENRAIMEAILKHCGGSMSQSMMFNLMVQCKSERDWQVLKEMFKEQDPRARSKAIMQICEQRIRQEDSPAWKTMLDLCDEQSLSSLAQNMMAYSEIKPAQVDILRKIVQQGAKIEFQYGQSERLRAQAPDLWKTVIDQTSPVRLESLWWEDIDREIGADALQHWGDKLPLVINLTKRQSQGRAATGLEHLLQRQSWEACEFLIKQNAKLPNVEDRSSRLFLQVATGEAEDLRVMLKTEMDERGVWKSPYDVKFPLSLLHSAIRMGRTEACGILAKSISKLGPNDSVLYAIEQNQWECLQEILNSGHELQIDEVHLINQKSPERLALIMSNLDSGTSPKNMMILIDGTIDANDKDQLRIALARLRILSEKQLSDKQSTSLETFVGKDAVKRTVGSAISHPELLAILQIEGFPIGFANLLQAVRDGNLESTEICLRSFLMMKLTESDREELNEEVAKSPSNEVQQLFKDLALN